MDRLQETIKEIGVIYDKLKNERIKAKSEEYTDFNTYRKLADIMFKTFNTYLKLDRDFPDYNYDFIRLYYKTLISEAKELSELFKECSTEQYRCLIDIRNKLFEKVSEIERYYDINFYKAEDNIKCKRCDREFSEYRLNSHFYPSNTTENGRMILCKECIQYLYNKIGSDIKLLLETNDLPYYEDLWKSSQEKQNPIGNYLGIISSFRYSNKTWKDSIYTKDINELTQMNKELGLFKYQQKVIEFDGDNLICDWSRNSGKTYTIAKIIELNMPKNVLFIDSLGSDYDALGVLCSKFNEINIMNHRNNCETFIDIKIKTSTQLKIEIYNPIKGYKNKINIYTLKHLNSLSNNLVFEYVFYNNLLPYNVGVNVNQSISFISYNDKDMWLERFYPHCKISKIDYKPLVEIGLLNRNYIDKLKDSGYMDKFKNEYAIID